MTQVYVLNEPETSDLLTSTEVANIWNVRAAAMGFPHTRYTAFSVRQRRASGALVPAMKRGAMYLYHASDARAIELQPQKSRRPKKAA